MDHLEFQIPHLWKGILIQPRYKPINMNLNNEKYVSECEITSVCVCAKSLHLSPIFPIL